MPGNTLPAALTVGLAALLATVSTGCSDEFNSTGAPPTPPCHPAELEDDFGGGEIGLLWEAYGAAAGGTIGVADGHGMLEVAAGVPEQNLYLVTRRQYDLTGCNVWLEVPTVPASDAPVIAMLQVGLSEANAGVFQVVDGELAAGLIIDNSYEAGTQKSHDPVAHRWWRIRHGDGDLYFETSPDGADWELLLSSASPGEPSAVTVAFALFTYGGLAPDQRVRFELDNLNLLP